MKALKFILAGLIGVVSTAGCSNDKKPAATPPQTTKAEPEEHTHGAGPNGGVVFDFGGNHAEFFVDHAKQLGTIVVLAQDQKTPTPIAASEILLNINETKTKEGKVVPAMTITLKPAEAVDGKASKFVGTDAGLGNVADFQGTISCEIDAKPAMGEFKE